MTRYGPAGVGIAKTREQYVQRWLQPLHAAFSNIWLWMDRQSIAVLACMQESQQEMAGRTGERETRAHSLWGAAGGAGREVQGARCRGEQREAWRCRGAGRKANNPIKEIKKVVRSHDKDPDHTILHIHYQRSQTKT